MARTAGRVDKTWKSDQGERPVAKTATEEILAERGKRYGNFFDHASISQSLKQLLSIHSNKWSYLSCDQKEALEMICHKMARIINGDPNWSDSWRDIAGYAELVAKRLEENAQ